MFEAHQNVNTYISRKQDNECLVISNKQNNVNHACFNWKRLSIYIYTKILFIDIQGVSFINIKKYNNNLIPKIDLVRFFSGKGLPILKILSFWYFSVDQV